MLTEVRSKKNRVIAGLYLADKLKGSSMELL